MAKPREPGWLPFRDEEPLDENDLNYWMGGDTTEPKRITSPAVEDPTSSGGGERNVDPAPDPDSDFERLEKFLTFDEVWEMIEKLEKFHKKRQQKLQLYGGRRRGAKRGYVLMDILAIEAATHFFDNGWDTLRNLRDRQTWRRLRKAVRRAYPKKSSKSHRRLSKTAPSRDQCYRARRDFFSGEALRKFKYWYRRTAVKVAVDEMGLFDPDAGSWTHPHKDQCIVGDMSWFGAATRFHGDDPFRPDSAKLRRYDPYADFHHTVNGGMTRIPGRELVVLSARTGHGNERILLDFDFMPRKRCPSRKNRNEADHAVGMLKGLLKENRKRLGDGGAKVFIFDMAMDAEACDDVLDLGMLPMAKVPRKKGGKFRSGQLGSYKFKLRDGTTEYHDVKTLNGSMWVMTGPDGYGDEFGVPLRRVHCHWGRRIKGKRNLAYMDVAIPSHKRVLEHLRGATATVQLNSTRKEAKETTQRVHNRRTKSLRAIPEADPDFALFGAREDIESTFSDLKHKTRGRLNSFRDDFYEFNILAYAILRLSRSVTAFRRRTTPAAPQPAPPTGPTSPTPLPGAGVAGTQPRRSAATSPQAIPIAA